MSNNTNHTVISVFLNYGESFDFGPYLNTSGTIALNEDMALPDPSDPSGPDPDAAVPNVGWSLIGGAITVSLASGSVLGDGSLNFDGDLGGGDGGSSGTGGSTVLTCDEPCGCYYYLWVGNGPPPKKCPINASGEPIQYRDGQVIHSVADLSSGNFALPWDTLAPTATSSPPTTTTATATTGPWASGVTLPTSAATSRRQLSFSAARKRSGSRRAATTTSDSTAPEHIWSTTG